MKYQPSEKPGFIIGSHWIYLFLLKAWFYNQEGSKPQAPPVSVSCIYQEPGRMRRLLVHRDASSRDPKTSSAQLASRSDWKLWKQRLTQKKPQLSWSVIGTHTLHPLSYIYKIKIKMIKVFDELSIFDLMITFPLLFTPWPTRWQFNSTLQARKSQLFMGIT